MTSNLKSKNWSELPQRALSATEIVAHLSKLQGWSLAGDGRDVSIKKTFTFANYYETISFVNAVAFVAHVQDHHPALSVHFNCCAIAFNTHDVGGLSDTDFECAGRVDALLS